MKGAWGSRFNVSLQDLIPLVFGNIISESLEKRTPYINCWEA